MVSLLKLVGLLLGCLAASLTLSSLAPASVSTRPGTIAATIALEDGSRCVLDAEICEVVIGDFLFIREPWDSQQLLAVWARVPVGAIQPWDSILVEGVKTTAQGWPVIVATRIALYTDPTGRVMPMYPKDPRRVLDWDYMREVPLGAVAPPVPAIPDPTPPPSDTPPLTGDPGTIAGAKLGGDEASSLTSFRSTNARLASYPTGSISLTGKTVTAVFYSSGGGVDYFYIQEPNRPNGIKVIPPSGTSVDVRDSVTVSGTVISGSSTGEAYISATAVTKTDVAILPKPLGMPNLSTAGAAFGAQPAVYTDSTQGQNSIVGSGLNVVGTRVKVWGKRLATATENGHTVYYIDDGSNLLRSGHRGLKVVYYRPWDAPSIGSDGMVYATGVLGAEMDEGYPVPVLRVPNQRVIHVKSTGNDSYDGCTWETAKATVQAAITAAAATTPKCEVWVAAETYYGNIVLADGVAVYGGFAGVEDEREQRNWNAHVTILDGNQNDSVVTAHSGVTAAARIDGFTIQNGNHWGGGGIYCDRASPTIAHNRVTGNTAAESGGGIYCVESQARIANNVIVGNTAISGGGIECDLCDLEPSCEITNNTVAYNHLYRGGTEGGGIYLYYSNPRIYNTIVAFNDESGIALEDAWYGGVPVMHNNDVWGQTPEYGGTLTDQTDANGNISANPVLEPDHVHIASNSPCKDAGQNRYVMLDDLDIDGMYRIQGGTVDIGCDEIGEGYNAQLTATSYAVCIDGSSTLTATFRKNYDRLGSQAISFSVTEKPGSATVTLDPEPATTGRNGTAQTVLTSDTVGWVTVKASATLGGTLLEATAEIYFYDCQNPPDDWPMFQHDIAHTGVTTTSLGSNIGLLWSISLYGTAPGGYSTPPLWSSPIVSKGLVYVGTNEGWFYAARADTGGSVREVDLGSPIHGTPCAYDGRVYVGTEDGILHGLNASTLEEEWTFQCPSGEHIWGSPVAYNGIVYFGTGDGVISQPGWLHAVRISDGQDICSDPSLRETTYAAGYTTPAIDTSFQGGRCYVTDTSCWVTSFGLADGQHKWWWKWDSQPMYASPLIYGGYIFAGAGVSCVYRLTDSIQASSPPYLYGTSAVVYSGIINTGGAVYSTPAASSGKIYFGCLDHKLYCVNASTLAQSWATDLSASVTCSPLVSTSTGLVFVVTDSGQVYALNCTSGSPTLISDTGQATRSSLAASGGHLFAVTGNTSARYLRCFGP